MNIDKNKIEYVIGIDLGHGETSAAVCPLQWDTPVEQLEPAKDLEMGANKKVLPSAITILEDGKAYIGDAAFETEILKRAKVKVCFKQAPKDINGEAENVMMRFMSEVYRRIRENNSAMLTDDNHLVYIATPSGWNRKTQGLYVEMARKAGLPMGGVTKESRAAFVRAQYDATSGLGKNVDKGAIVFDMGSSTLDFTYMNKNLTNLIDNGYNCGASFVEKFMFSNIEKKSEDVRLFEQKYPCLVDTLVFKARIVKEEIYFSPEMPVKKTINLDDIVGFDNDFEDKRFKFVFQPGELNEQIASAGYLQQIQDAMKDFREKYIPDQKIYAVFKTGGASRMDFLNSLICKSWGVDESLIYRDQDPSLTISQGVAEVARMDLRTDGMDTGLDAEFSKLKSNNAIYNSFVSKYGATLYQKTSEAVSETLKAFKNSTTDYSINNLQYHITSSVQKAINEESGKASSCMEQCILENLANIQKKVDEIVKTYSKQGVTINTKMNVSAPKISDINMDGVLRSVSDKIAAQSSDWGGAIAGAAAGAGIAILFGGPLLWLAGGLAFLGNLIFGKTEEEKKAEAKRKLLSKSERQDVYNSIMGKWDEIDKSISDSVKNSLSGDPKIKSSINQAVNSIIDAYKENLKSARVLIE